MKKIMLSNGLEMDIIGSGTNTFGKKDNRYMGEITMDTKELKDAIDLGYRHFDTAVSYRNEIVVGKAIAESNIERSEFFITTKIPAQTEDVEGMILKSLEYLQTSTIDLLLIHRPWDDFEAVLDMWHIFEDYYEKGILKAIGVSNFEKKELAYLLEHATIKPMVNQIESHPGFWNDDLIEYCQAHNIVVQAWGPLTRISDEHKLELEAIGKKYNKTWAQIALKYQIEREVVIVPKSHNKNRQRLNIELFDFSLTKEEKEYIKKTTI